MYFCPLYSIIVQWKTALIFERFCWRVAFLHVVFSTPSSSTWEIIFTDPPKRVFPILIAEGGPLQVVEGGCFSRDLFIAMENPPFWCYLSGKLGFSWAMLVSGRVGLGIFPSSDRWFCCFLWSTTKATKQHPGGSQGQPFINGCLVKQAFSI